MKSSVKKNSISTKDKWIVGALCDWPSFSRWINKRWCAIESFYPELIAFFFFSLFVTYQSIGLWNQIFTFSLAFRFSFYSKNLPGAQRRIKNVSQPEICLGKKRNCTREGASFHSDLFFSFLFFSLPHFPSDSLSPDERSESSRQLAAPLLKGYTVKLSAINTTKLQALYKMPISVLERMAIDCCREELIWMLLHFVSVSGFMEAGRTVDIMAEEGRGKKIEERTNTTPDDGSSSQCLFFSKLPLEESFSQITVNWIGCVFILALADALF